MTRIKRIVSNLETILEKHEKSLSSEDKAMIEEGIDYLKKMNFSETAASVLIEALKATIRSGIFL